jgi:hypothetical protein
MHMTHVLILLNPLLETVYPIMNNLLKKTSVWDRPKADYPQNLS